MEYIYDLNLLLPGDVILKRDPVCKISDRVMTSTNSEFSHAMLYLGNSSYIDVGRRVQARNLQRYVFESPENTCLLRLKKEFWDGDTIYRAIQYARSVVAEPYSIRDALNLEAGRILTYTDNTQICTRLVSKAYEYAGLKIVDNIEMCTPQEIKESKSLHTIEGCCRVASDFDIRFSKTHDVVDDMIEATDKLIVSLVGYGDGKLRSIENITNYAINHPQDDDSIAELLQASGYLDVLDLDKQYNAYQYNPVAFLACPSFINSSFNLTVSFCSSFIDLCKEKYRDAALQLVNANLSDVRMYENELNKYRMIQSMLNFDSKYLQLQIDLYNRIIDSYRQRAFVGMLVLNNLF